MASQAERERGAAFSVEVWSLVGSGRWDGEECKGWRGSKSESKKSALLYGENDTVNKWFGNYFLKLLESELD